MNLQVNFVCFLVRYFSQNQSWICDPFLNANKMLDKNLKMTAFQ